MAPKVVYVVPTFKWEVSADGKTSTRRGNGLRVYLERPWYSSGQGEKLAALIYRNSAVIAPAFAILDHCSRWGRDPVWDSKSNGALVAGTFKNGTAVTNLLLAESQGRVDAVVFDVEYNAERKLWFADLEFNAATYFPFVRLSLARYQSESLVDIELSPDVLAEFSQLVSDRTANFTLGQNEVTLTVSGPVADNAASSLLPAVPKLPSRTVTTTAPRTHRLVAYYQIRPLGSVGDMGWSDTGGEALLAGNMDATTRVGTWSGKASIPTTPANMQLRLVVEEREYYLVDGALQTNQPATDYRVVYVDVFNLR